MFLIGVTCVRDVCKKCGESVDHLLLYCPIAFELWSSVFCLFGLHWVMPHLVFDFFESWQGKFGDIAILIFGDLCRIA